MAVNLNSDVAKGLFNSNLTTQAEAKSDKSTLSTDDFWKLISAELKYDGDGQCGNDGADHPDVQYEHHELHGNGDLELFNRNQ